MIPLHYQRAYTRKQTADSQKDSGTPASCAVGGLIARPRESVPVTGDPTAPARAYYRAIDEGDYAALRDLLADDFVQHRPDMTLEGADAFVRFMRDDRPETDTTHAVEHVYRAADSNRADGSGDGARVAVEGRLERASGETWFRFVDAFLVRDGRLAELRTYTE